MIKKCYVRDKNGVIYVQKPTDGPWGFDICDDDQAWPGGLGYGGPGSWEEVDESEVPEADRERLGWLLEDSE